MSPDELALSTQRQKTYGAWQANMHGTSEQMQGLLRQWKSCNGEADLPSWWFPLTMVIAKLNRVASGRYHQDNFDDLRVYLSFVEEMQRGAACGGTTSTEPTTTTTPVTRPEIARE